MTTHSKSKQQNKSGRAPTGTIIKLKDGRFQPVVTLADGKRKRFRPFPAGTSEARARDMTAALSERVQREGLVSRATVLKAEQAASEQQSCEDWVNAWNADRENRGLTSTRVSGSHWTVYLKDILGNRHAASWTRDDFRKLSKFLDEKVAARTCTWKTAANLWGTATKRADDACNHKDDAIRCRNDNPAEGIRGPDRGERTIRQYLYPSEFLALVACEKVSLEWRRIFAVAVYSYARLGELLALTWADVDLEHAVIRITRSIDSNTGREKATKSKCPRTIPIEPELMPLLMTMYAEGGHGAERPSGPVLTFPTKLHHALALREALAEAGVTRAALFTRGPSVKPIRFHDLRATGITWMAVRGDEPLRIQARAGHTSFSTPQGYIREPDVVRAGFGQPFPVLPKSLAEGKRSGESFNRRKICKNLGNFVGAAGFEPATSSV